MHFTRSSLVVAVSLTVAACSSSSSGDGGAGGESPATTSATSGGPGSTVTSSSVAATTTTVAATTTTTASQSTSNVTSSAATGVQAHVMLSNAAPLALCNEDMVVWAAIPQESNHLVATKLTPPAYPFAVTSVGYDIGETPSAECASQDHDIFVFVSSADAPSASPSADMTLVDTQHVPLAEATFGAHEVELTAPVVLQEGEHLYVAIQVAVQGNTTLCLGACADGPTLVDVDFWSGSPAEPYPWIEWTEYVGAINNLTTRAFGHGM